ncbi:MAG: sugar transferase [Myxococcota bacterium]|nr:sugar transferase [Myxococcota bacterium]
MPAFDLSLDATARDELFDELFNRYAKGSLGRLPSRVRALAKRWAWSGVVGGSRAVKRGADIAGASMMLIVLSPVFGAVALAIKLTDNGPVLFWQKRIGQYGEPFDFPKFRSMVANAEQLKAKLLAQNDHGDGITFKMKRDPRVTWIGRLIRKTSIDELPQLINVLRGEMSLVGPRPPVPGEVARYTQKDRRRLEVKPGLTCIWQVSGRGDIPFPEQVELDVRYIESQSIRQDLTILLQTIPAVLLGKGAY